MKKSILAVLLVSSMSLLHASSVDVNHDKNENFKDVKRHHFLVDAQLISDKIRPSSFAKSTDLQTSDKIAFAIILEEFIKSFAHNRITRKELIDTKRAGKKLIEKIDTGGATRRMTDATYIYREVKENSKNAKYVLAMEAYHYGYKMIFFRPDFSQSEEYATDIDKQRKVLRNLEAYAKVLQKLTISFIHNDIPRETLKKALTACKNLMEDHTYVPVQY